MLKCQHCGKELKNQGAVNLHERKCKENPNRVRESQNNNGGCDCEYRLLNPKRPPEKMAIENGYKEVCVKCQNLR